MLIVFKPFSNSVRGLVLPSNRDIITTKEPYKPLTSSIYRSVGRDSFGHISSRHKSAGHKKLYRKISFARKKYDVIGSVDTIEYDPNRNCLISLISYADGDKEYIIAPDKIKVGDSIISSMSSVECKIGNAMPVACIPSGVQVHNIELKPGCGGIFARSAGSFGVVLSKTNQNAMIRLSSGEVRLVDLRCFATIGTVSNPQHSNIKIGKAGRSRWLGRRPSVRGVAMNPVDHPHGGGEGKSAAGRPSCTPWGKPTKGYKTRKNKRTNKFIVSRRVNKV